MGIKISGMTPAPLPLTGEEEIELSIPGSAPLTRRAALSAVAALVTALGAVWTVEPQYLQANRYLMRDGTFRDPTRVGLGTFTVGSISTIIDNTRYNAWPTITRMKNGSLILVYTDAYGHHLTTDGTATGMISEDEGVTWGAPFTIYDDATQWVESLGVTSLSSGRVVVTYFKDTPGGGNPLDGAFLVYSDDYGATWCSPVTVNSSLTSYSYMSGPVVELPSGDLLVTIEGKNSGDTYSRIRVLRSTDQGATWGSEVDLATGTRNYYETRITLLDNGTLLALLRTADGDSDTYKSFSTDNGATWSAPTLAFAGHGQPNCVQLSTGTLIAITRANSVDSVIAYTSLDRGVTWSSATTVDATMNEMEYGAPVELIDGRVLVVYGYQVTSAETNSDIKQAYLTEDVVDLRTAVRAGPKDMISGYISAPSNKTYKLVVKAAHAGTIREVTTISESGTATATFKINTTALGGSANAVSSSEQSQAHTSANAFAAGDDLQLTVSANSSCVGMSFTIAYDRAAT